ncbi:phosphomannose isomerase type II C-terminal cupin domain [Edaphocola aurantiacus]|jgi:mannose-6-phosphate isomerase|uniref:phosphomannose isomerase type II C-terminal cupin domain n=1 Tax=Edaphocola aurantiacus TaxID=2601682 RepID=UPI001C93A838|nr:phosphomannose isomerase type II C-terminal cupin domain [Edaphocola aurantiacus]
METDIRPWGQYWVLEDAPTHKVKRIVVKPKGRLSYQYHHHRSEIWTIIEGEATITLDGEVYTLGPSEVFRVPQGAKHRLENRQETPLTIIEIQYGTYFGEDDIIRLDDDYQRV